MRDIGPEFVERVYHIIAAAGGRALTLPAVAYAVRSLEPDFHPARWEPRDDEVISAVHALTASGRAEWTSRRHVLVRLPDRPPADGDTKRRNGHDRDGAPRRPRAQQRESK